jgi:hypothetical protein
MSNKKGWQWNERAFLFRFSISPFWGVKKKRSENK